MRGSGPRGAGRRRPPGGGGGGDPPNTPASLAGCYSAPRRAPLWTCLLLCAALRTLVASPSNEGRALGVGTAATQGGGARRGLEARVPARWTRRPRTKSHLSSRTTRSPAFSLAPRRLRWHCLTGAAGCWALNLQEDRGCLGGWEVASPGKEGCETRAGRLGAAGSHLKRVEK